MRRHGSQGKPPLLAALIAAVVPLMSAAAAAAEPIPPRGGFWRLPAGGLSTFSRRPSSRSASISRAARPVVIPANGGGGWSCTDAAEGDLVRGYAALCGHELDAQGEEEAEVEGWGAREGLWDGLGGGEEAEGEREGEGEGEGEVLESEGRGIGSEDTEVLPSVFEGPQLPHADGLVTEVTRGTAVDEEEEGEEDGGEEGGHKGSRPSRRLSGGYSHIRYSHSRRPSRHQQWQQQQQQRPRREKRTAALQIKQQQGGTGGTQGGTWRAQGGMGAEQGETPEWAKREQQRWERDQRPQTAEEIRLQEEHWREQQQLVQQRLRRWRQQSKRLVQTSRAQEKVWAAEARSRWARERAGGGVQGTAQAQGFAEGGSVTGGRYAVMTEDDLDEMMPGGTQSWQRLKSTARSAATDSAATATVAAVDPEGSTVSLMSAAAGAATVLRAKPKGAVSPCSPRHSSPVIKVFSSSDIARRTRYSPRQTVTLVLYRSISLARGLLFASNFSCTIFRSRTLPSRLNLMLSRTHEPVLRVHNASNILFIGIGLKSSIKNSSPFCESLPEYGGLMGNEIICPALHIYRSFGIQFTQAPVFGRIDVFRSGYTKLDSLFVTAPGTYERSPGIIRMGMCGLGTSLTPSKNVISNNDVFGAWELMNLYRGTIGVQVHNNFLHDYLFAGFRCGADVHYSWDCMLVSVKNNFVFTPQSKGRLTFDSAGIYFCTHWFNPGSTVSCNYVIGGDHCYYLDYCTSGVEISGGVCAQLWDGVKLNNGKRNRVRSLLMVSLGQSPGYITCLTVTVNHCGKDPGTYWERMRQRYYNTPEINKLWPWMKTVCRQTRIGSQQCNPKGPRALTAKQTGACSGLPTENDVELIAVDADTSRSDEYRYCERAPAANKLNRQVLYRYTGEEMKFRDYKKGDYGVKANSIAFKKHKGFVSCPRGRVGIMPVSVQTYYKDWNIPAPTFYRKMVALSYNVIYNKDLI